MPLAAFALIAWIAAGAVAGAQPPAVTTPAWTAVAPGVEFAVFDGASLSGEAGPVLVHALRLDPSRVRLELALAGDTSPALERVEAIAARHGALAAVNAGFFLPRGRPAGLLVFDGRLLSPGPYPRAALGLPARPGGAILIDRVRPTLTARLAWGGVWPLVWFETRHGTSPLDWLAADDVIGGAGLIAIKGRAIEEWADERVRDDFRLTRHPRTLAATDATRRTWLVAIDGRRPGHSLGVSFAGLSALARGLGLVDVVNLDGGGSTTMVVAGRVVNRTSDVTGPRAVSDALLVLPASRSVASGAGSLYIDKF